MHEDESAPIPLQYQRRSTDHRKRLMSWRPDISAGTILLAVEIAAGGAGIFWAMSADKQHTADMISRMQSDIESNRIAVKETIIAVTGKLDKAQDSLNALSIDVAVIKKGQK